MVGACRRRARRSATASRSTSSGAPSARCPASGRRALAARLEPAPRSRAGARSRTRARPWLLGDVEEQETGTRGPRNGRVRAGSPVLPDAPAGSRRRPGAAAAGRAGAAAGRPRTSTGRSIDAENEAFRDHWGSPRAREEGLRADLGRAELDTDLWVGGLGRRPGRGRRGELDLARGERASSVSGGVGSNGSASAARGAAAAWPAR